MISSAPAAITTPPDRRCSVCQTVESSSADPALRLSDCARCHSAGLLYCSADCRKRDVTHRRACLASSLVRGMLGSKAPSAKSSSTLAASTSPAAAPSAASSAAVATAASSTDAVSAPSSLSLPVPAVPSGPFAHRLYAGQGRGLAATSDISAGSLIFDERPLMLLPHAASDEETMARVQALPAVSLAVFNSMHAHTSAESDAAEFSAAAASPSVPASLPRVSALICCNSMRCGAVTSGLFGVASRLNHSCAANCTLSWSAERGSIRIIARRDIAAGEQLTVTYVDALMTQQDRRQRLQQTYGFTCACSVCTLTGAELTLSDQRRLTLAQLETDSIAALLQKRSADCIQLVERRLTLMDELIKCEGVTLPISAARSAADAAEAAAQLNDQDASERWMRLHRQYQRLAEGPGDDDDGSGDIVKPSP